LSWLGLAALAVLFRRSRRSTSDAGA
jgi:hypothetical protein